MSTLSDQDTIESIAAAVAARIQPRLPINIDLWSSVEIAAYLKRDAKTVMNRIACQPKFPSPIRIPVKGTAQSQPLWRARDVIEWAEGHISGKP